MLHKFLIPTEYGNAEVFIGNPEKNHDPLFFQSKWYLETKNQPLPGQILGLISKLNDIAIKNKVNTSELIIYALAKVYDSETNNDESYSKEEDLINIS